MRQRADRRAVPRADVRGRVTPGRGQVADVLAWQRSAGNAAVTAALARHRLARVDVMDPGAVAVPVPVEHSDPATADTLTLAQFNDFTERQLDWGSQKSFLAKPTETRELREVLLLSRANGGALLSAAGELVVADLRAAARTAPAKLAAYASAVKEFGWTPAPTVNEALAWGDAAPKLRSGLGAGTVAKTIKQGTQDSYNVEDLVAAAAVDDLLDFVKTTHPVLSATNGAEVRAFLGLRAEGSWRTYVGNVGPIKNIHHFTKGTLD